MLGQPAQTRQEVEKLLAEKYGRDHIVVETNEPPSNPYPAKRHCRSKRLGNQEVKLTSRNK
jgi:hypothetical protein